ncbi:hypothetical protein CHS0354_003947, partial [Potamilus streckersoni]
MNSGVIAIVLGLLAYVCSGSSTVWVKEVTAKSHTNKRIFGDPVLPHQLTFHIRQGSHCLTLNLKRNYDIDPNADIYVVQMSKDGPSIPKKTINLGRE